jgi:hypothetical protein
VPLSLFIRHEHFTSCQKSLRRLDDSLFGEFY